MTPMHSRLVRLNLVGTGLFLAASFMIGRRAVARLILWCNDHMRIEMPVISAIATIRPLRSISASLSAAGT